jgi:monofunctional biosynthetic peptidoglycan transglycosylase
MVGQKRPSKPPAFILTPQSPERVQKRARQVQHDLDYELSRLRGRKRLGLLWLSIATLGVALILVPLLWMFSLREEGPRGTPAMMAQAAGVLRLSQVPLPLEAIDPILTRAVVAAVDPAFCADGAVLRQRVAQEVLLWPSDPGKPPSAAQRLLSQYLAGYINVLWSQPRVVEVYLNNAVWGRGQIGVEAASMARYGISARALDPRLQALPLALAVSRPSLMDEATSPPGALIDAVDALVTQVNTLNTEGAFSCLGPPPPAP